MQTTEVRLRPELPGTLCIIPPVRGEETAVDEKLKACLDTCHEASDLLKVQHVVGVGPGNKTRGGKSTGELATVFYVTQKVPAQKLGKDALPKDINGLLTDVVALGSRESEAHNVADLGFVDWGRMSEVLAGLPPTEAIHGGVVDLGDIAVVEDDGTLVLPNGTPNYARIYAKFRQVHPDIYDFVTFFTDFPVPFGYSFWSGIYNNIKGICLPTFNYRPSWNSNRLLGFHFINNVRHWNSMLVYLQETGHQWGAFVYYKNSPSDPLRGDLLLGGTPGHWDRYFDDDHSPMDYDNLAALWSYDWTQNADGSFTRHPIEEIMYCDLDLYLMGLLAPSEVRPFSFIKNPVPVAGNPDRVTGTRAALGVNNIVLAMSPRDPDSTRSQRHFKEAWILLTRNVEAVQPVVAFLEKQRHIYTETFYRATRYRARLDTTLAPANARVATGTIQLTGPQGDLVRSPFIAHGLGNMPVTIRLSTEDTLAGALIDSIRELKSPDIAGNLTHLEAQVPRPYNGTFQLIAQNKTAPLNVNIRWWAIGI